MDFSSPRCCPKASAKVRAFVKIFLQAGELERSLESITALNIEMLTRLAGAAEFRDDNTGQHTERVGQGMAALLAKKIGLPDSQVSLIQPGGAAARRGQDRASRIPSC